MEYFIWKQQYIDEYVMLNGVIEEVEDEHLLTKGISFKDKWSKDAFTKFDDDFPDSLKLVDNLCGTNYIIISKPLKEFLKKNTSANVEYLPLKILNHKGRVASEDYFFLNPLDIVDCIDKDSSELVWDNNLNIIDFCENLRLNKDEIDKNLNIFRAKYWTAPIIISGNLKEKLESQGFTGLYFEHTDEYSDF